MTPEQCVEGRAGLVQEKLWQQKETLGQREGLQLEAGVKKHPGTQGVLLAV